MNKRTARIPVLPESKKILVQRKKKLKAKLGRKFTWDEFLLNATSRGS